MASTAAAASHSPAASHRDRLIDAIALSIAQKGYRATTVADIVRLAHTSRRSFYEHFTDRDDCFLAMYAAMSDAMIERIAGSVDSGDSLEDQVDQAIATYVDIVLEVPALWDSFVVELPGLGGTGFEIAQHRIERLVELLIEIVENYRGAHPELSTRPLDHDTATIIVGGLRALLISSMRAGRDMGDARLGAAEAIKAILARRVG